MIRTVIIDDEPRNIKLVSKIIMDHIPSLEVVGTTDNLTEIIPLLQNVQPQLLLVDIGFPAGTIFSALEKLPPSSFEVIFITAHNNYAAEAFRQNAVDYILKPVTKESLISAVQRVQKRMQHQASHDFSKLLETLKPGMASPRKIPLPSTDGILFINESDIIRCEAMGRYTNIHLCNGRKLTVTKTLKEIEIQLSASKFFRVHNSHIINLELISKYHRGQGGTLELTDGSMVEVSSSRKEALMQLLLHANKV